MQKENSNNSLAKQVNVLQGNLERWKRNFNSMRNSYLASRSKLQSKAQELVHTENKFEKTKRELRDTRSKLKKEKKVLIDTLHRLQQEKDIIEKELEKEIKSLKEKVEKEIISRENQIKRVHASYEMFVNALRRENTLMFAKINGIPLNVKDDNEKTNDVGTSLDEIPYGMHLIRTNSVTARESCSNRDIEEVIKLINSSSDNNEKIVAPSKEENGLLNVRDDKGLKTEYLRKEKKEEEKEEEHAKEINNEIYSDDDYVEYIHDAEMDKAEKQELETAESIDMHESRSSDSESNEQDRNFVVHCDDDDDGDDDYNPEDDASDDVDCVMTQPN